MNIKSCFSILFFAIILGANEYAEAASGPYEDFYSAMQSDDTLKISTQLATIEKSSMKEKEAYAGALLMRMSGLVKSGVEKLSTFKKGRVKLEQCIKLDSLNAEYRFLRLLIQEHIPDFMNYHSKKSEDSRLIKESFGKLQPRLQDAILNYSKHSLVLKPEDLNK